MNEKRIKEIEEFCKNIRVGMDEIKKDLEELKNDVSKEQFFYIEKNVIIIDLYNNTKKEVKLLRVLKQSIEIENINFIGIKFKEKFYNTLYDEAKYYNYDGSKIIYFNTLNEMKLLWK